MRDETKPPTREELEREAERMRRHDRLFGLDLDLDSDERRRKLLGIYVPRGGTKFTTGNDLGDDP